MAGVCLLPSVMTAEDYSNDTPDLPILSVVGKQGKFYAGIGGTVKATLGYDFGNVVSDADNFVVSSIPTERDPGNGGALHISAQQTELYFVGGYAPGTKYAVDAYVQGHFLGENYRFLLENAWVKFMGLKAGYGYGLFSVNEALPQTIDHEGPNGALSVTNALLDYTIPVGNRWSLGIGVEKPVTGFQNGAYTSTVNSRIPDIPVCATYDIKGGHLRAAAMWRGLQYRDDLTSRNRTASAFGVALSGYGELAGPFGFCFQTSVGRGISSYYQDLNGLDLDMVPSSAGKMKCVKSWGGYWGATCKLSDKLLATATYSHLRIYPGHGDGDSYSYGQYVAADMFYNITPIVQCGVEYIYGRRVNINGTQGHDSRIQTMVAVSF